MNKHLGLICTIVFLPAFAVILHDSAVAFLTQQPLRLSALGYLWDSYAPSSLRIVQNNIPDFIWASVLLPILKLRALPFFASLAGAFYLVLFIMQKTRTGFFRFEAGDPALLEADKPDFLKFRRRER